MIRAAARGAVFIGVPRREDSRGPCKDDSIIGNKRFENALLGPCFILLIFSSCNFLFFSFSEVQENFKT
jgi:hypothetical protein